MDIDIDIVGVGVTDCMYDRLIDYGLMDYLVCFSGLSLEIF